MNRSAGTEGSGLGAASVARMDSAVRQTSAHAVPTVQAFASYANTRKILIPIRPRASWGSRDPSSHLSFLPGGGSQGIAIRSREASACWNSLEVL